MERGLGKQVMGLVRVPLTSSMGWMMEEEESVVAGADAVRAVALKRVRRRSGRLRSMFMVTDWGLSLWRTSISDAGESREMRSVIPFM